MSVASVEKQDPCSAPRWSALLLLAMVLGAPVQAQDEEAADKDEGATSGSVERAFIRSAADTEALAQRYPHLAVWLEPEDSARALALVERETTEAPAGAMVIVADEGRSANDTLLEALRSRLTEAGWATMTLGLEQPTSTLQLARQRLLADDGQGRGSGDDEEGGSDGPVMIDVNDEAAEDLLEAHREEMNARLASAVAWFAEQDYRQVVLVGVGSGAEVIRAYLPEAPQTVTRVAWVVADFGPRSPAEISDGVANATRLPILDMYSSRDPASQRRRAAFRRAGVGGYEALSAPIGVRPGGRDAGAIANRLLGWSGRD